MAAESSQEKEMCIVINGDFLNTVFNQEEYKKKFIEIIRITKSVIACRVTPK
jgi:hypothetical protein